MVPTAAALVSRTIFFGIHLACLLPLWCGVSPAAIAVCVLTYSLRMFGITGGYHRYFSHRSFETSRAGQFVLACLGASAGQKGPLWWAAVHRHHHAHSDRAEDVHSPREGFWWSHIGWILSERYDQTGMRMVAQLAKYPELRWIDRFHFVPAVLLALAVYALGAWLPGTSGVQTFAWGFCVSTVLVYHATFMVNSLAHLFGTRRYRTKDDSRNNIWIALLTFGEGWHNNHHFAPSSERQGFFWWEIDLTHYILALLAKLGVVWNLKRPPSSAYAAERNTIPFSTKGELA